MKRRGAVLLEVVAALTIFAFAAVTAVDLLTQLAATETQAVAGDRVAADQDRLMTAYALLDRADLERRLGARRVGAYTVSVQRPAPAVFRVTIGDSSGVDLVTLIYRPPVTDGR